MEARTALPNRSIWSNLPEDTFRQHLVQLEERTNAIPMDPQVFDTKDWLATSSNRPTSPHILPLELEQQVVDDFAFLAAVAEGAQSVAAVCLEDHVYPPGLTLRFAALDISLSDDIKTKLQFASQILVEAVRDSNKAASEHIESLFQHAIKLHFNRLLARLRSSKWEKPKYLSKSHKKPLWQDFANLSHRVQFLYAKKEKPERQLVESHLHELSLVYENFETSQAEFSSLLQLVDSSFTFCSERNIQDFLWRLQTSSKPTPQVAAAIKSIRQIQKIAAYRRVCISLVQTAKHYPALFQNIDITYLTPYRAVSTSTAYEEWAKTCHVHAEVQLAVYYDLNRQCRPRCIGTSKWLCYLCYQFLRAHADFFPSRTHGRLYDQWTIPDLEEFDEVLSLRYRGIVQAIDDVIVQQIDSEPVLWRVEPMTSCVLGQFEPVGICES